MESRRADEVEFERFVKEIEPRLRRAFVAGCGSDKGRDATAEALAWAWTHWKRVRAMSNPAGYLYRVGQSRTRRRRDGYLVPPVSPEVPWVEPRLPSALTELTEHQRVAVVLVHGFGWTASEVADLTGVKPTTVQSHLERGLARLRAALEVYNDA
jgi:DNA-directed RNA polymerase specialized sigma24 family protein